MYLQTNFQLQALTVLKGKRNLFFQNLIFYLGAVFSIIRFIT